MSTLSNTWMTRVVFFQVQDSASKCKQIVETAQMHFSKKEPLIFFVEDEKAALFVDELLWKFPSTSFLPHTLSDSASSEMLVITSSKNNVNQACYAFNLSSHPLFLEDSLKIIYEFEDGSSPIKKNLSSRKFDAYKKAHFFIEAR